MGNGINATFWKIESSVQTICLLQSYAHSVVQPIFAGPHKFYLKKINKTVGSHYHLHATVRFKKKSPAEFVKWYLHLFSW